MKKLSFVQKPLFFSALIIIGITFLSAPIQAGQNILNPIFTTFDTESAMAQCLAKALREQAPKDLFGMGEIYTFGPSVKRDYLPVGSTYEIAGTAPNGQPLPRFRNLAIVMETADRSVWQTRDLGNGVIEYRTQELLNPAFVFERFQMKFLFEVDLSGCIASSSR